MRSLGLVALLGCTLVAGCARPPQGAARPAATASAPAPRASARRDAPGGKEKQEPKNVARPSGLLTLKEAREYMLALVNRDRASEGLGPVTWDDTAAKGGQKHSDDMVRHGFVGHLGTDGSVPEQRYANAGGTEKVQENAGCMSDGAVREIEKNPRFLPEEIEKMQSAFFNETPPNDGHRKNILKPWHNRVGFGMTKAVGVPVACTAQEFVDAYGTYGDLPAKAKVGQTVAVEGEVFPPAVFAGIGIARIAQPKPLTVDEVNKARTYRDPQPYVTYFPKGYKTPIPVAVTGNKFSIRVPLSDGGKPGLYEVSVWANVPQTKDLVVISLRAIAVE
jgi:uncharacterized protein YkwD